MTTSQSQSSRSISQRNAPSSIPNNEDYYDIDSILLTNEKIPVVFLREAKNLGFLDPGNPDSDLKEGSKVNLPLWLARELFKYRIVDISTGSLFDDKVRANLQADPTVFSMHRHPYFYELGLFLSSLQNDSEFPTLLIKTFKSRYVRILDNAYNWRERDDSQFTYTLTRFEKKLFELGHRVMIDFERWKERRVPKILPSSSILFRKRKRDDEF